MVLSCLELVCFVVLNRSAVLLIPPLFSRSHARCRPSKAFAWRPRFIATIYFEYSKHVQYFLLLVSTQYYIISALMIRSATFLDALASLDLKLSVSECIPDICHFFTLAKFLENKIYTEKRQFFALNL